MAFKIPVYFQKYVIVETGSIPYNKSCKMRKFLKDTICFVIIYELYDI